MGRIRLLDDEDELHHAYFLCKGILCLCRGTEDVQVSIVFSMGSPTMPYILAILLAIAANSRRPTSND